ncbi:hypothetical protein [Nocardia harenae]|uniref:hypothetical protein n=1 Tax=Nocardia harenae TaxID=358707 RepID=UPI001FDF3C19|nr:hypothetical protein [Nocardia harenae]
MRSKWWSGGAGRLRRRAGWSIRTLVVTVVLVSSSCALLSGKTDPTPVTVAAHTGAADWRARVTYRPNALVADFTRLQEELPGAVGLAVLPVGGGRMTVLGDWTSGIAWSTIKVPLALAALRKDADAAYEAAEAAITVSDNDAAWELWQQLGDDSEASAAVQEVLDEAGRSATGTAITHPELDGSSYGSTEWSLTDQATFAAELPCLSGSEMVTALMGSVTPEQSWGLGRFSTAQFKGGWGPDDDTGEYTVRQFGTIATTTGRVAVAMAARADSGGFDDSTALLDTLAQLLARHIGTLPSGGCPH